MWCFKERLVLSSPRSFIPSTPFVQGYQLTPFHSRFLYRFRLFSFFLHLPSSYTIAVVAIAAGFVDGLAWGNNAKAAIMRIGLIEMKKFSEEFFPGVQAETFVQEVRLFSPFLYSPSNCFSN